MTSARAKAKSQAGYTLVEILLVVFLCGLIASVAWPTASHFSNRLRLRAAVDTAVSVLSRTRELAVLQSRTQHVMLRDPFLVESQGEGSFYPDGSADYFRGLYRGSGSSVFEVIVQTSGAILVYER